MYDLILNLIYAFFLMQEMTLEEYEKLLEEKRKALLTLKTEERKVDPKEFASMQQLSCKKENNDIFIKLVLLLGALLKFIICRSDEPCLLGSTKLDLAVSSSFVIPLVGI